MCTVSSFTVLWLVSMFYIYGLLLQLIYVAQYTNRWLAWRLVASFPDSTPQLFIAPCIKPRCDKKLGSGVWERG